MAFGFSVVAASGGRANTESSLGAGIKQTADSVLSELKARLVPLTTAEPGGSSADLAAFGQAVGDARVVALGEASHGTHEIFRMKHRLFEYLVREKGFTVVALEPNWPESEEVDEYIKTGQGDPRTALRSLGSWPPQTEELLEMVEWMRAFNRENGNPTLSFTSFDMQRHQVALEKTLEAIRGLPVEAEVRAAYAVIQNASEPMVTAAVGRRGAEAAEEVVRLLERAGLPARTVQLARIVAQATRNRVGDVPGYRDRMMAENVLWLMREAYPNQKVVLWAHNTHVSHTQPVATPVPAGVRVRPRTMGSWLRPELGSELFVLGFGINEGTVRANVFENGRRLGLREASLPRAPGGSGTAMLSSTGVPIYFLDMGTTDSALARWLAQEHLFQELGAGFDLAQGIVLRTRRLGRDFDALIYLDRTTASRGL